MSAESDARVTGDGRKGVLHLLAHLDTAHEDVEPPDALARLAARARVLGNVLKEAARAAHDGGVHSPQRESSVAGVLLVQRLVDPLGREGAVLDALRHRKRLAQGAARRPPPAGLPVETKVKVEQRLSRRRTHVVREAAPAATRRGEHALPLLQRAVQREAEGLVGTQSVAERMQAVQAGKLRHAARRPATLVERLSLSPKRRAQRVPAPRVAEGQVQRELCDQQLPKGVIAAIAPDRVLQLRCEQLPRIGHRFTQVRQPLCVFDSGLLDAPPRTEVR